jgi:iron complex outermembrane recepter protein
MRSPLLLVSARAFAGISVLLAFQPGLARGQAAPQTKPATDDAVITLSPFEVTDRAEGYRADAAVSGLKYQVSPRDVPLNMTVFTSDIIRDFQPIDVNDIKLLSVSHGGPFRGNVIRGFSVSREFVDGHVYPSRFAYGHVLERVEIIKGPAGVLYGQTSPGGVINYIRKRPVPGQPFTHLTLGVGNSDRYKVAIDFNNESKEGFMASKLHYRLSAAWSQMESEQGAGQKHGMNGNLSVYIPMTFNPWKNTTVTVYYDYEKRHLSSREGETARSILQGGIPIAQIYGLNPYLDFGAGIRTTLEHGTGGINIDQRIGENLILRGSYNYPKTIRDHTGHPRPGLAFTTVDGKPAVARTFTLRLLEGVDPSANLYARYSAGWFGARHEILAGINHAEFKLNTRLGNWLDATGAVMRETVFFLEEEPWTGLPGTGFRQNIVSNVGTKDRLRSGFVNYLGRYMDGNLNILAGGSQFDAYSESTNRIAGSRNTVDRPSKFAPQAGALYNITPRVGVFAMFSSSYEISHRKDGFDRAFSPSLAEGIELGTKWSLNDDRLLATVTYYNARNKDIVVFDPNAPNNVFELTQNPVNLGAWVQKGEVEAKGIELELVGRLAGFEGHLGYAHNNTKISKDSNPANVGNPLPFQTPNRVVAVGKYTFPGGPLGGLSIGGLYTYNDESAQLVNNVWTVDDSWWRFDAFVTYRTEFRGTPITFRVNGRNLNRAKNGPIFGSFNPATGRRFMTYWGKPQWWFDVTLEL